jgi:hypothetical protein
MTARSLESKCLAAALMALHHKKEGKVPFTATAFRFGNTNASVTADFIIGSGGSAVPGADFIPRPGTLRFAAGERLVEFAAATVLDDGEVEFPETIEVQLLNSSGGTLSRANFLNFAPPIRP